MKKIKKREEKKKQLSKKNKKEPEEIISNGKMRANIFLLENFP